MAIKSVARNVWFSARVLGDYQARGAFVDLIRDYGTPLVDGGCLLRDVPRRAVLSILADCIAQGKKRTGKAGRGLKVAYTALYSKLITTIGGLDSDTYYYLHYGPDAYREDDEDVRSFFRRLGIPEAGEHDH